MPINPISLRNLKKMRLLEQGEASRSSRVRGKPESVEWWCSLTADERGQLVEKLHTETQPARARASKAEQHAAILAD